MAGCLFDELLHRVVAPGIEEWGSYPHVANVTLEDGTSSSWVDLLSAKLLRLPAMAKGYRWLGTHIVDPGHHPVG